MLIELLINRPVNAQHISEMGIDNDRWDDEDRWYAWYRIGSCPNQEYTANLGSENNALEKLNTWRKAWEAALAEAS